MPRPDRPSLLARIVARVLPAAIQVARASSPQPQAAQTSGPFPGAWARSGGAKWPGGLSSPYPSHALDHYTLRQAARDAVHDSQVARSIVGRWAESVVGTGLRLAPEPNAALLGMSDEQADVWAQNVAQRFHLWASSKEQHRSGTLTWYQSQFLYELAQHRDNDMFVRLFYNARPDLLNPLQWEAIDPNQIRGDAWTSTSWYAGAQDDGIERDEQGYERGYKVWVMRTQGPGRWTYDAVTVPRWGEKSGRLYMLHGFTPEYAGQGRGFSRIAHAVSDFEKITDFSSAEVQKAIAQSMLAMFAESSSDAPAGNPFESLGLGAGPAAQQFGVTGTPDPSAQNVTPSYTPVPEATMAVGGVGVFSLDSKQTLKPFQNTAPVATFDKFVDAFVAYLAAGVGIPIEMVLMRFNANYSASRGALVVFWRNCILWREEMASDYLGPVYEMWLAGEIAAGRVSCPGFADPVLRQAWLAARWVGLPMPNIDPNSTAKADQLYVEMGAQTLDDVARNLNGSSGKSNRAKLAREYAELRAAGKTPWAVAPAPRPGADGDGESGQKPAKKKQGDDSDDEMARDVGAIVTAVDAVVSGNGAHR
jgi:lambda family phage portal protein